MKNSKPQPSPSSPFVTTDARLDVSLLLTLDGTDTDIQTKAWRSLQSEGIQLQFPVLIHSGDASLHSAQRRGEPGRASIPQSS